VRPDGTCGRVAVMIYRESHGADVASSRFTAQYAGKSLADPIRVDRDVINVAGSTLSAHAICRGVRKALAVVKVVLLDKDPAARAALLAGGADVTVVADHPANVAALDAAAATAGRRLPVIVDFDVGQHRTGTASEPDAVALAQRIAASAHLVYAGLQAYYGHLQQIPATADREAAAAAQQARVRSLRQALAAAGLPPAIITGGGTGTAFADLPAKVFTELQPGSYLFLDSCYGAIPLAADGGAPFRPSLFVQASIVSVNQPGLAVCNAGLKSFATDSGKPRPVSGTPSGATYRFMGDEHGGIELPAGADAPALGAAVELLTSHCDPTVNLHDWLHCVRGDLLVDIWPVDARGR
jgi:3-hydroxy-D-aspartate aldolase